MAGASFEQAPAATGPTVAIARDVTDLIMLLPPRAADRLRDLRQRSADANAVIPKHEQMREVTTAKIETEQRYARLIEHPSRSGFGLRPTDVRVVAAEKAVEEATAAVERL